MLKIDSDKTIHITRGDSGTLTISANNNDGTEYAFQTGDIVRLKVMNKNNVSDIVLTIDKTATAGEKTVDISFNSEDTRIGELINKPVTYWYEVELNPDNNGNTIIGYDEDGAKLFILYPEGKDE